MAQKRFPITLRELEVMAARRVSPKMVRITFGGPQMGAFISENGHAVPAFASEGPDDHVKIFFPDPETGLLTLPTQADGHLDWPSEPRPTAREYTPRSFDAAAGTCDFEFVLHDHGLATTWAAQAKPGDTLFFAGPKASMILPEADWYLLVGDETALPAIGNWLELLPRDAKVSSVVLLTSPDARIDLPGPISSGIEWVDYDPARPATLRDAVAKRALPEGKGFVWGAGEREAIRLLRGHLVDERGLDKRQLDLVAYWYHGVDDAMVEAAYDRLDALSDLSGPFALRAAATHRLADHVSAGATTIAQLAEASGCSAEMLTLLVPVLIETDVFTGSADALGLGALGQILVEDEHAREHLDRGNAAGRRGLAWAGLIDAMTGGDAYRAVHGQSYVDDAASPALAGDFAHEHGHLLEDLAEDAAKLVPVTSGHMVDVDGGIGTFLIEVLERQRGVTGTLVERDALMGEARDHVGQTAHAARVAFATTLPAGAEGYLLGGVLGRLGDNAVLERLRAVATVMTPASRLFVLEPGASDYPRWQLELRLAQGPSRSHDALAALARTAGLTQTESHALPDGAALLVFSTT